MGYPCIYNYSKDCDACDRCEKQPVLNCDQCDKPIYKDEIYFEIDNEVYCEECLIDTFGHYA